jgi:hypothetical protein
MRPPKRTGVGMEETRELMVEAPEETVPGALVELVTAPVEGSMVLVVTEPSEFTVDGGGSGTTVGSLAIGSRYPTNQFQHEVPDPAAPAPW